MRYFKCGKCAKNYKISEDSITRSKLLVTCNACGAKNAIEFGPVLVIQNPQYKGTYSLKMGVNKVGRTTDNSVCPIQINDAFISREHLAITLQEQKGKMFIFIEDLGSRNGTFNREKKPIKKNLKYPFTKNDFYIAGLTKLSINLD